MFDHGDDFAAVGKRSHLAWFVLELAKHMMVKDKGTLGPDQGSSHSPPNSGNADLREIRLLAPFGGLPQVRTQAVSA